MKKILFVCEKNSIYSASAQGVLEKMLLRSGYSNAFMIESAGLNPDREGVYPDLYTMRLASTKGYNLTHRSRKLKEQDFDKYDYIIALGNKNFSTLSAFAKNELQLAKMTNIVDYCTRYFLNDFPEIDPKVKGEAMFDMLEDACGGIMEYVSSEVFENF